MRNLGGAWTVVALGGLLLTTTACDLLGGKKKTETTAKTASTDKLSDAGRRLCASNATYARLKESAFDEAKRVREQDTERLDALAAASVVRMERPLLESRDEALGLTVCSGRMILELPPGAGAAFGGKQRLAADVTYSAQAAADGSSTVFKIDGGEPIIYRLASFDPTLERTRTAAVSADGLDEPAAVDEPPVVDEPPAEPEPAPVTPAPRRTVVVAPPPPPARKVETRVAGARDIDDAEARIAAAERARRAAEARAARAERIAAEREKQLAAERRARTERVAEARRTQRGEPTEAARPTRTAARNERPVPPPDRPRVERTAPRPERTAARVERPAARPSFNCRYARSRVEKLICGSPELAARDRRMASTFYRASERSSPEARRRLSASRLRFLAYRDRCGSEACVANAYSDRIDEINDLAGE